jgi:hypothetical protein
LFEAVVAKVEGRYDGNLRYNPLIALKKGLKFHLLLLNGKKSAFLTKIPDFELYSAACDYYS